MKRFLFITIACGITGLSGFAPTAFAAVTPTLSVSTTGSGDNVQVDVHGDANTSVLLSYTKIGVGLTISSLGTTNGSGSFSTVISSAQYGITSGTLVTALLGGTAGARSNTATWPTVVSANALALSQTALVINAGSSNSVTATNTGGTALYVSSNSNPSVANVSISGTQVTFSGNTSGSTSVTICTVGNTSNCPIAYITVVNAGAGQLTFSQNSVTVVSGQNLPITISGGNGSYSLKTNTNSATIQASLSGSVLTLSTGSSSGSSAVTICSTDMSACGVVQATAGNASSIALTFSNSAPVVSTGQSATVAIYGPSGVTFYVSSNSNPSIVQPNLSGTTLTLAGIAAGSSSITVCASTGTCNTLTATVQYVATSVQNIGLSQNTLTLTAGQNANVTISGGEQPYTTMGGTSSVSQQTISGTTLTVYGVAAGSSTVSVCSAGGGCISLAITVTGSGSGTTSNTGTISLSQNSVSLTPGQSTTVYIYGTASSNYYLSANGNSAVASVSVSGSTAVVSGVSAGTTYGSICQSSGSPCATLTISVSGGTSSTGSSSSSGYTFTSYLHPGVESDEVLQLQKLLTTLGYLTATPTGYYGTQTTNAVIKFQAAKGIDQLGVVGPSTRAALNKLSGTPSTGTGASASGTSSTAINNMTLAQLKTEVQALQSLLTQALNRISQLSDN